MWLGGYCTFYGFYIHVCKVVLVNYMSRRVIRHAACVHSVSLCCPCVVPELVKDGSRCVGVTRMPGLQLIVMLCKF